jgi:hypothetical protein
MKRSTSLFAGLLLASVILTASAPAAVLFTSTGFAAQNEKKSDGVTNIPVGNAFILVADTNNDGFGAFVTNSIPNGASLSVGSSLDGDLIFYRSTDAIAGASNVNISNLDITAEAGQKFALLWFNTATGATTTLATGDLYGIVTDNTWVLPTVSSTLGFSTSPSGSNPYLTQTSPGAATLLVGSTVPEPGMASLSLLGFAGLFFRRRR